MINDNKDNPFDEGQPFTDSKSQTLYGQIASKAISLSKHLFAFNPNRTPTPHPTYLDSEHAAGIQGSATPQPPPHRLQRDTDNRFTNIGNLIVGNTDPLMGVDPHIPIQHKNQGDIRAQLEVFTKLNWIFRSVFETSSAIAKCNCRITLPVPNDDTRRQTANRHRLLRLLRRPNLVDDSDSFWRKTVGFILLTGEFFWYKQRSPVTDEVIRLDVIRPDRMIIEPMESGGFKYTQRLKQKGQRERRVPLNSDNLVHGQLFNPLNSFRGMGMTQPAQDSAVIDLFLTRSDKKYWTNAINPRFWIKVKESMGDDAFERLKIEVTHILKGIDQHHSTPILEGAELEEIVNRHHVDKDVQSHRTAMMNSIFNTYGVYHLIALNKDSTNRAAMEVAYRWFWEQTVLPLQNVISQKITTQLLWEFAYDIQKADEFGKPYEIEDLEFEFDVRRERALRESAQAESIIDFRDRQIGARTINQIILDRGLGPPIPGGDDTTPLILMQMQQAQGNNDPNDNAGDSDSADNGNDSVSRQPFSSVTRTDMNEIREFESQFRNYNGNGSH